MASATDACCDGLLTITVTNTYSTNKTDTGKRFILVLEVIVHGQWAPLLLDL